jgi:ribulose-phosphate 3-epimerase
MRLGIDIGGTKVNIGIVGEDGAIAVKGGFKIHGGKSCECILSAAKDEIERLLGENGLSSSGIGVCGIGVPGTVDESGKIALKVPNLGWENERVSEKFTRLTGIPSTVIQDSRAAAYGEYKAGAAKGAKTAVCVTLGTGIGTGAVIDGKIYNGALNGAGELGHIPVAENGRECGCGKRGCLEKYAAGIGFDITAREIYGDGADCETLFAHAKKGDAKALKAVSGAVAMLGGAMVSLVNLMSPDCLLFSGGLSNERELVLNPLISYIKEKCYAIPGKEIKIAPAALGGDAPMLGAALYPEIPAKPKKLMLSASVMCADMLNLERDLAEIKKSGISYLHFDIMDGRFVPNLMLPIDLLPRVRKAAGLPFDVHIMAERPEEIIPKLSLEPGDFVSIHYESTPHAARALSLIKNQGARAAVAINPGTPLECVRECLEYADMVLVMTVNPGFAGQNLAAGAIGKIRRMREYLDGLGKNDVLIEADGNCSFENIPKMLAMGADCFVAGSSSVFGKDTTIKKASAKLREVMK